MNIKKDLYVPTQADELLDEWRSSASTLSYMEYYYKMVGRPRPMIKASRPPLSTRPPVDPYSEHSIRLRALEKIAERRLRGPDGTIIRLSDFKNWDFK